jgi:hypothetical protein
VRARYALVTTALALGGCYQVNSGAGEGIFHLGLVIMGLVGLLGVAFAVSDPRGTAGTVALILAWLLGGTTVVLTAMKTELFFPWPGTFRLRELWLLWLPQPMAVAPILATARLLGGDQAPRRSRTPLVVAWALVAGYAALLVVASVRGTYRPALPGTVVEVAVTSHFGCFRTDLGTVVCAGHALPGKHKKVRASKQAAIVIDDGGRVLRVTSPLSRSEALAIDAPARDVAGAAEIGCAVDGAGRVVCFDTGPRPGVFGAAPTLIEELRGAADVEVSDDLICVVEESGAVGCVPVRGSDSAIFASDPGDPRPAPPGRPHRRLALREARGLAVTASSVCVLTEERTVECAGDDEWRELGQGAAASPSGDLRKVQDLSDIVEIAAGTYHVCARTGYGEVRCWGGNGWNQLGPSALGKSSGRPVTIDLPAPAVELFAQRISTCARLEDKRMSCWGAQVLPGARFVGVICDSPFLGLEPPTVCAERPEEIRLPDTFLPPRPR